jgi:hypothetical protein
VPRFFVRGKFKENGQIAIGKEWFPVPTWCTWLFGSNVYSNGGPVMDTSIARLYSVVDEVFIFVRGSGQGMEISEVERTVLAMLMRVGREGLKSYVDEKGTGYCSATITLERQRQLHLCIFRGIVVC